MHKGSTSDGNPGLIALFGYACVCYRGDGSCVLRPT